MDIIKNENSATRNALFFTCFGAIHETNSKSNVSIFDNTTQLWYKTGTFVSRQYLLFHAFHGYAAVLVTKVDEVSLLKSLSVLKKVKKLYICNVRLAAHI